MINHVKLQKTILHLISNSFPEVLVILITHNSLRRGIYNQTKHILHFSLNRFVAFFVDSSYASGVITTQKSKLKYSDHFILKNMGSAGRCVHLD